MNPKTPYEVFPSISRGERMKQDVDSILRTLVEAKKPMSKAQIKKIHPTSSYNTILEDLASFGFIKSEIRAEEFITITERQYIKRDPDGNIIPAHVPATLSDGVTVVQVDNPAWFKACRRLGYSAKWEEVEKQVQVKRKYFWVE